MDFKNWIEKFLVIVIFLSSSVSYAYTAPLAPTPPPRYLVKTHFEVVPQGNGCFINVTTEIYSDGSTNTKTVTLCPRA